MARTKKTLKALHIRLWKWLSKNPSKIKTDWPEWKLNGGKVDEAINDCFACEYASEDGWDVNCSKCPCKWGRTKKWNGLDSICEEDDSPYRRYVDNIHDEVRSYYADKISKAWVKKG